MEVPSIDAILMAQNGTIYHESWFWCRSHERPESGGWTMINCVRVGPFESEDVADAAGTFIPGGADYRERRA